jgi:hypothetical protein
MDFRVLDYWGGAAPWPPNLEEGPAAAAVQAVRLAEGEAVQDRRRPTGAGTPVGSGGSREKTTSAKSKVCVGGCGDAAGADEAGELGSAIGAIKIT